MSEILYLQFTNPTAYPPLEHSALILQEQGWCVRFLGVRWPGSGNLRFPPALAGRLQLLQAPNPGWRQKLFYLRFQAWAVLWALLHRPRWVYVSDPMASLAGLLLSLMGFQVAYHEHDSPDGLPRSLFDRLVLWCRRQLARRARFNVLPQQTRCRLFQASTGTTRPVLCVWNCPRLSEVRPEPRPARRPDQPLGIYYHGSINLTRFPLTLIEAAGATGLPIRLRAVGYETVGSIGASDSLRRAAARFSPQLQLELMGSVSRGELFDQMEGMHLGWIAYDDESADLNLRHLAGASNKAFDYLASGLALITNRSQEWLQLFNQIECSESCSPGDPESIKAVISFAHDNPLKIQQMGEEGRLKSKDSWNYNVEFLKAAALIDNNLNISQMHL